MELQLFPERPPTLPSPAALAVPSTSYGTAADLFGRRNESSGSDLRAVTQPQRQRSGVWVALRPAENQVNEPFLPQLPKSFLRIKNERMTIKLLMRYLANKLGLHDESEGHKERELQIIRSNSALIPHSEDLPPVPPLYVGG